MNGFFFVDKERSWTSRDVCNKISHLFSIKKVGHTGTLDPFATGLLIVSLNSGTKASTYIDNINKEYIATLSLGKSTNTGDINGEVTNVKEVPKLTKEEIKDVLDNFLGKQTQIPPMTSAIHYNGAKLYELAHQGIEVERKPRNIEIFDIEFISFKNDEIVFRCVVSTGTYIRVLGEDIAKALNTLGYLKDLRRTKIGSFSIDDAKTIDQISELDSLSIADVLGKVMPVKTADEYQKKDIMNGKIININIDDDIVLLIDDAKNALAVYGRNNETSFKPLRGLW